MFTIQTERLSLCALNLEEVHLLSENRNAFERSAGLSESRFELNADESFLEEFEMAMREFVAPKLVEFPDDYQWFTHWIILEKSTTLTVGGMGTSGLPDENGQTMIGYFIDKKSEGKGYASEAVIAFCEWLFKNQKLRSVYADTPLNNKGSQKVLQNAGFQLQGPCDDGLRWILNR